MTDLEFLQLTLQLAAQGAALVSPNPLVGSVVVRNGQIVGRGYHRYDDLKHAEVWALEEAGPRAKGATVYVNLEPCCHRGFGKRTSPCVDALVEAGVAKVVASMVDPNPRVNGSGFAALQMAGIEVSFGAYESEAQRLNEKYVTFVTTNRPFVHLKLACSLDGRIATKTGEAKWITGDEARAASQALRHEYDAILVGINTVLIDDPMLSDRTVRPRHRPLLRVVLDSNLRTPLNSRLVQSAREYPLLLFTNRDRDAEKDVTQTSPEGPFKQDRLASLVRAAVEVCEVGSLSGQPDLSDVLDELGRRRITGLIVEGGSEVAASFVDARLVDKVTFFYGPLIIGGKDSIPAIAGPGVEKLDEAMVLREMQVVRRGSDWEVTGYPITKVQEA